MNKNISNKLFFYRAIRIDISIISLIPIIRKNLCFKFLNIFLLIFGLSYGNTEKINTAVNELQPKGIEKTNAEIITEKIRAELVKTGVFRVLERGEMNAILVEQNFQRSDICDQSCVIEMGQLLGVRRMISGTIGKIDDLIFIFLRMIDIQNGEILYSINEECECSIKELMTNKVSGIALKMAKFAFAESDKVKSKTGKLTIETNPSGSIVYLNKEMAGKTPFENNKIEPGVYSIDLKKPTYEDIIKKITLTPGEQLDLSFSLKHPQTYIDSLKTIKKRRQLWRKLIFGVFAGGFIAGGLYMNYQAQDEIDDQIALQKKYDNATSGFDPLVAEFERKRDKADLYITYRNILYACSGAAGVGFTISFIF